MHIYSKNKKKYYWNVWAISSINIQFIYVQGNKSLGKKFKIKVNEKLTTT